jgi:hypothetical protein
MLTLCSLHLIINIPPNPVITHMVYLCGMMEKVGRGTVLITEQTIEFNERMRSFVLTLETGQPFGREDYEPFF